MSYFGRFGEAELVDEPSHLAGGNKVGDHPIFTFVFEYRSRNLLEAIGAIAEGVEGAAEQDAKGPVKRERDVKDEPATDTKKLKQLVENGQTVFDLTEDD